METQPAEWQSPAQLAQELDIPLKTVYRWRYDGHGPVGHKIGRHVRYRRRDVEEWLTLQSDGAAQ